MLSIAKENDRKRLRAVPLAMILIGLLAVFIGLLNPGGATEAPPAASAQLAQLRADANAGFPLPSVPDNPPRGPGA